jgi:ABC-type branched-subunit amino acid transport system substrate-binding protein
MTRRRFLANASALGIGQGLWMLGRPAFAQKHEGPGFSTSEIRIGQTMAYSGPASIYGTLGKAGTAYFAMVNASGGVNGRKINLISLDDAYSPPKTVEQTRKLVEQEDVLAMFNSLGTATNTAVMKYLNAKGVPQLFIGAGGAKFTDPKNAPWTMGFQPNFTVEARLYAKYLLKEHPNAKIAVLYANDDLGKDYLAGLKLGLGDKAKAMVVAEQSYETSDPTIDSQMLALKASGADTFFSATTPKFAAQALKKAADMGWKPLHLLTVGVLSVTAVLQPAGLDNAIGAIGATYYKDPGDPQWKSDAGYVEWLAWMKKYYPAGDTQDALNVMACNFAQAMVQTLKQCGDDLSRANVMKQALNLNYQPGMTLPGVKVMTSPTDYSPVKAMQMQRFDGKTWVLFGGLVSA